MDRRVFMKSGAMALVTMGLSPTFLRRTAYGAELLRGAALMRLRRILGLLAANHRRRPLLVPEGRRRHLPLERCDRMRGDPLERPGAQGRIEILEHAVLGIRARVRGREIVDHPRRRAVHERVHSLAGKERKRIDEAQPGDTLARELRRFLNHHSA